MKNFKHIAIAVAALALAIGGVSAASAHSAAMVTIRHETHGCHAWSYNNGTYKAALSVYLARGATLRVQNNDVMPHKLVRTSGPTVKLVRPAMNHTGASAQVHFTKAGTYKFTTKAGEDYSWASHMKTTGEDNVLRLTVTVR